jgi:hypothetical protein
MTLTAYLFRYRQVPTFGRDTIRKFSLNCSEMKRLAAHNFEDLLQVSWTAKMLNFSFAYPIQCAIPVFEGLLPEPHNRRLLKLLFLMAHWHALAKLHLHTDPTLDIMDSVTTLLGQALRDFKTNTCSVFTTCELRKEMNVRNHRQAKKSAENRPSTRTSQKSEEVVTTGSRLKEFNLNTYKFHALGDVANTI